VNGTNLVDGGSIISGATNVTLTISNAQTNDNRELLGHPHELRRIGDQFQCRPCRSRMSRRRSWQPASQTNGVGTTVILAVIVTNGTPPFSYQWQVGGMNLVNGRTNGATISGATSNVLTISNVQPTNGATNYTVIVKNIAGSVTSSIAVLTVYSSPVIVLQPTNQAIAVGSNATFTVTAIGTVPLHYQWWERDEPGEEWRPDQWRDHQCADHRQCADEQQRHYTVIVTNIAGSVTSSVDSDGDEHPAGDRDTTDQPDERGGNDCDPGCHRDRDGAVELPVAGLTGRTW
jgi:hypothetical protein